MIGIPMFVMNVVLFFGTPLITFILFPLQKGTNVWQTPRLWDATIYLVLCLVGGLTKGFIRPTEDEENPYSTHTLPIHLTIAYFMTLFLIGLFIVLMSSQIDQTLPWLVNVEFKTSWWVRIFLKFR
jgi:hypothetical protein